MRRLLGLLAPLAVLVAGCGDDDPVDDAVPTTAPAVATSADDEPETTATTEGAVATETPAAEAPEGAGEDEGLDDPGLLLADLSGGAEVPGPGDERADGRMEAELVDGSLCADLVVRGLDADVVAAHVHEGAADSSGPPVLDLGVPTTTDGDADTWTDVCLDVDPELVESMAVSPERFYANVHTEPFPDGAVRGQLTLGSIFDRTLS